MSTRNAVTSVLTFLAYDTLNLPSRGNVANCKCGSLSKVGIGTLVLQILSHTSRAEGCRTHRRQYLRHIEEQIETLRFQQVCDGCIENLGRRPTATWICFALSCLNRGTK